ncbi:MAG: methyltransferase family protein [Candidatus Electronema sp. VV]
MFVSSLKKIFGVGPAGMMISFALLLAAFLLDRRLGCPAIMLDHILPLRLAAGALAAAGCGLLAWGAHTLRSWWRNGELCTGGPFRWFRHPIYAAYLTFIFPAAALFLNSWLLLIAAAALHPLWHLLVRHEEAMMLEKFAERYRGYMERTGRFFPKFQQCF